MISDARRELLGEIWKRVDPRLRVALAAELEAVAPAFELGVRRAVLVGQRAAGKSWLLPLVARWMELPGIDLDVVIEARSGRRIAEWLPADAAGFRATERSCFASLPSPAVVAVGGGFLGFHAEALSADVAVLVPMCFETYVERLRSDSSRPRLRPELSVEEEMKQVFFEREALHALVPTVRLPVFLKATLACAP